MTGYLLDTNIASELRKGRRANQKVIEWIQTVESDELFLSVLSMGEIRNGVERIRMSDAVQAGVLERWLKELEVTYGDRVLPVTLPIADAWGRLTAKSPLSVVDCLLAATALEHDLVLATRNVQDVIRTGVKFLNPFEPAGR